jgi:hypothetical protein
MYEKMFPPRSMVRARHSLRTSNPYCRVRVGQRRESRYSAETGLLIEHDAAALVEVLSQAVPGDAGARDA